MYRQYGFEVPRGGFATTADEAAKIASEIGFPVALKIVSPDILHKTDVGGVVLDLESPEAVRQAFEALRLRCGRPIPKLISRALRSRRW